MLDGRKKVERENMAWISRIGKSGGLFKLGNDYVGFIKCTDRTCNCTLKKKQREQTQYLLVRMRIALTYRGECRLYLGRTSIVT